MDDYERTTREVRIDEPIDAPATPVAVTATPVVAAPAPAGHISTEHESTTYRPSGLEMARRGVALAFGILQALLVLRIILLLLVANRENGIVQFILSVSGPFVSPFRDMFSLSRVEASNGSVLDVGAIVALIAWTLIEALVLAILRLGSRRPDLSHVMVRRRTRANGASGCGWSRSPPQSPSWVEPTSRLVKRKRRLRWTTEVAVSASSA